MARSQLRSLLGLAPARDQQREQCGFTPRIIKRQFPI